MNMEVSELSEEQGQANLADRDFSGGPGVASSLFTGKPWAVRALWIEVTHEYLDAWFGTTRSK